MDVASVLPNARWIPALAAADGRRVRPRALLRCGALDDVSAAVLDRLRRLAPSAIIDLRSAREITRPHPLADEPDFRHRPFIDDGRDHERDAASERSRSDLYRGSLRRNRATIAAALRSILDAPEGPVLVHCRAGVDRTGMLTALILDAVGVERASIVQDYASWTDAGGQAGADTPDPTTMADSLAYLDEAHGGTDRYLQDSGLPPDVCDQLLRRFTTTP